MHTRPGPQKRSLLAAEQHVPDLLQEFLRDIEITQSTTEVWERMVQLGRSVDLPLVDYVAVSNAADWKRTLFVRTSYDSRWLYDHNQDPEVSKWSYLRSHAVHQLTPILIGLEFIDEYLHLPEKRVEVLREAAQHGIRSGFSVPLRVNAPPQTGILSFCGDHAKRDMLAIVKAHGWTLNVAALVGHQRYMAHFAQEFLQRNDISDKQTELLSLIGRGMQDKQIAARLRISVSALRQRMQSLMAKTGTVNRAELAALAMGLGMLPDPQRALDPRSEKVLVQMDGLADCGAPLPAHEGEVPTE